MALETEIQEFFQLKCKISDFTISTKFIPHSKTETKAEETCIFKIQKQGKIKIFWWNERKKNKNIKPHKISRLKNQSLSSKVEKRKRISRISLPVGTTPNADKKEQLRNRDGRRREREQRQKIPNTQTAPYRFIMALSLQNYHSKWGEVCM